MRSIFKFFVLAIPLYFLGSSSASLAPSAAVGVIIMHGSSSPSPLQRAESFVPTDTCITLSHLERDKFVCNRKDLEKYEKVFTCAFAKPSVYVIRCANGPKTLKFDLRKIGPELKSQFRMLKRP